MRVSRVARCLTERDLQGLGPLAALKSEGSIVVAGSIGLTVVGLVVGQLWFMSSALLTGLFLAKPSPPLPTRAPCFSFAQAAFDDDAAVGGGYRQVPRDATAGPDPGGRLLSIPRALAREGSPRPILLSALCRVSVEP